MMDKISMEVRVMNIGSITSQQPASSYSKKASVNIENKFALSVNEPVEGNQKTSSTQKDSSAIYEELSSRYDVRNATFGEIVEMSGALYGAGEISLSEHAALTFDYDRASDNLRRHSPGYISEDFNLHETFANSNGQRDWIAEFEARASKNFKFGNILGYESDKKVLDILGRLSR